MPTIEERKFELKQKRSDALMAKINILRARDGSVAPPIDSMKDEDEFNLGLLFGSSRNDTISYSAMGVEGLIRLYYEIIYKLTGKVRNNIIKHGTTSGEPNSNHNSSCRSGLTSAVSWFTDGQGYKSGFYIGWAGIDVEANDEDNLEKKQRLNDALSKGRKGEFDVPMTEGWTTLAGILGKPDISSTFTDNRDSYLAWVSNPTPLPGGSLQLVHPPNDRSNSLSGKIDDLLSIIGENSEIGPHTSVVTINNNTAPNYEEYINDTLLGFRHRDVAPASFSNAETNTTGGGIDPATGDPIPIVTTITDGSSTMGDGTWDIVGDLPYPTNPPGYLPTPDYWTPQYEVAANVIITAINDLIDHIGYTNITNFTYFVNYRIIPGIDLSYDPNDPNSNIGSSWNLQNRWIIKLEAVRDRIQQSIDYIAARKESYNKTYAANRTEVDQEIFTIKSLLYTWLNELAALADVIDNGSILYYNTPGGRVYIDSAADLPAGKTEDDIETTQIFGSITNPMSLYGHRFLWIRTLIHASEGTMTSVNSTGIAIDMMEKKLKKSEDELYMFGILEEEFIPVPIIVGIEPYPVLNQATFEMEIGGWLVAWGGQEHCIGYDVEKSDDYDPATKLGTWIKLEVSNTTYTMTDINANTGKVLTYIIDGDVEPIPNDVDPETVTHPYYRVKAYDINGGSGDYSRTNSQSEKCEPKNPAAFPFGGESTDSSGPRSTQSTPVTTTAGTTIPPNTLFWVTTIKGMNSADFDRRTFISEAPFDSTASNLIVFVDGEFKNQGLEVDQGDYELVDLYTIKFHQSVEINSEVNLVVAMRSFANSASGVKGTIEYFDDLPTPPDVSHGDIYFVENPTPGQHWQYFDPPGEWREVADPNGGSIWRDPVNTFSQLPSQLNADGDIRLVLDTSTLYRWEGTSEAWVKISGAAGGGWLSPVDTSDDLDDIDTTNISNGAIIFVIENESLYRWSSTSAEWLQIAGSNAANWKGPVNSFEQLPDSSNSEGDIRLVLGENKIYRWFAWDGEWRAAKADADLAHRQLDESDWEIVDDHDARYYPKEDIDETHNDLESRLLLLESLKPNDAEPLSGNFALTGTKLYRGFLSDSTSILNYDTLQPNEYFTYILKDASFIMSNNNAQQFKDADQGVLYCYINGSQVDEFDLGTWFNEAERETGQSYPRQFGINNVIEILSVQPYNQYATYQRADFQLNIKDFQLIQGENKIQLIHEVGNLTSDVNSTEEFIIFWDAFDGEMGFKEIYVDEVELNSSKYLSGIRYYSIGDVIRLRFEAENLFNNSYVKDEQIYIGMDEFAITPFHTNFEDADMIGTPIARIGEDIYYTKELTIDQNDVYSSQPILKLEATNPFKTYQHQKNDTNFLINTISTSATDLREVFVDEVYRLPLGDYNSIPTITGQWDSTTLLSQDDLQVFDGKLVYPSQKFENYHPTQTVDYSVFSGAAQYIRAFTHLDPHNNGKLTIGNFYSADPNIKVEIKLPGLTGWLSLNDKYNAADFVGADGDGCLIRNSGIKYYWTSGQFSTANSGYMIIVRVTMYGNTNNITDMEVDW